MKTEWLEQNGINILAFKSRKKKLTEARVVKNNVI